MITIYPYAELGHANHGWLDAHYHFNFADYRTPQRPPLGALRVINDDHIQPASGFALHPHKNMEIITYVRQGAITHQDNQGNHGRITAGQWQVMHAGTGIWHSEYNEEPGATRLYQIWITPRKPGGQPSWAEYKAPATAPADQLNLMISGDGQAPLTIDQDAMIHVGNLHQGATITQPITGLAYLLVAEGTILLDGQMMQEGDGAAITDCAAITLQAETNSQLVLISVPAPSQGLA